MRYVYPVNYQVTSQGQGSQIPVATDNQNQTIPQQSAGQQPYVTQYGQNYNSVPLQGTQSVENYSSFPSQSTYPIPQSDSIQTFQTTYPLPYSQSNFIQNPPSQVFYSNVPCSQPLGYSYGTNQGPYQTGTTPPSQQQPQPQSANISVQTVTGQQLPQPVIPSLPTPTTPQFNPLYPTMQQCQGQPQFRQANPQILQIPGVQQHNVNLNPVGVSQTFPQVIRNMQMNVPVPGPAPQGFIPQSGQVTVSAKGVSLDNQMPKIESGGENKEYILGGVGSFSAPVVAGPPRPMGQILRPQTQVATGK